MKVKLITKVAQGSEVLVHETEIPPFAGKPDVLLWGTRVFVHTGAEQQGSDESKRVELYREVFAYALPE